MTCCFFGHKDTPETIREGLEQTVRDLLQEDPAAEFLVGNQGHFDWMVYYLLKRLKPEFPNMEYHIVLAYLPGKKEEAPVYEFGETLYPDGLESAPKRFAISKRNDWMLKESDVVVAYVRYGFGGAAQFVEKAVKRKMRVINLCEDQNGNSKSNN